MGDEIRDLDDVEAQAWAQTYSYAVEYREDAARRADECVRLLRERREKSAPRGVVLDIGTSYDAARHAERAKIAAWLRSESDDSLPSERAEAIALLDAASAIDRGEHDK